jgi:citrate synthase
VCAAILSDIFSAVIAAIGILREPLFGSGNEIIMELIERIDNPVQATRGICEL